MLLPPYITDAESATFIMFNCNFCDQFKSCEAKQVIEDRAGESIDLVIETVGVENDDLWGYCGHRLRNEADQRSNTPPADLVLEIPKPEKKKKDNKPQKQKNTELNYVLNSLFAEYEQ